MIIAQLKFTDEARYRRYQNAFAPVFAKFNGRLVAAEEEAQVLEGDWPNDKVVILEFPDRDSAMTFQTSPEYQEIASDRVGGADATVLMVRSY